jgi:hypothetical protein
MPKTEIGDFDNMPPPDPIDPNPNDESLFDNYTPEEQAEIYKALSED